MASSGQTIPSAVLRDLIYHYFVRCWGKKVFFMIFEHLFLVGQSKKIYEILVDNGVSLDSFTRKEISQMSGSPEDLNIPLMNKICWEFWAIRVGYPGKRMKNLMTNIKSEWKTVHHDGCYISETKFPLKVLSFQTTLEETLDAAKYLLPRNGVRIGITKIDQLKNEIKGSVPFLLGKSRENYDPAKLDDLHKLQGKLTDFWNHFYEYILQLIQDELKSLHRHLCKICLYDFLAQFGVIDPCSVTVSLKMEQQKEFHSCHESERTITVDQNEILVMKDPRGKDPEAVIISGNAGAGKSTILCIILEKWLKGITDMPSLSSFEVLLYMQFRNRSVDNFDRYLEGLLPKTLSLFSLENIKAAILCSKCLILCDGYDEADDNSRKLFEELITLNCKEKKIVVTTRFGSTNMLTKFINRIKSSRINLSILGLQAENMKTLIEKITSYLVKDDVTQMEKKRELFQVIDNMNRTMITFLETPLYFNLFILLYLEDPKVRERIKSNRINLVSTLYTRLEELKQDRIIEKTGIQREFLKEFDELYLRYAIHNYKEKRYELSQKDIDNMKSETQCFEVVDNFDSLLSSYFNVKHSIDGLQLKKVYCYTNASELEFAAARKISEDIQKSYRTETGNIVESALRSNGFWGMWKQALDSLMYEDFRALVKPAKSRIYLKQEDIINFLMLSVGILDNGYRNILYSIVDDIHNLVLKLGGLEVFYLLLRPSIETGLDTNVLDSLARILESTSAEKKLCIHQTRSLFALPQLLQRLDLKHLEIKIEDLFSRKDFPSLTETVKAATDRTYVHLHLAIDLKDIAQLSGSNICTVDKLHLNIDDNGTVDPIGLCPFPISSKDLSVVYKGSSRKDIKEVSKVINAVWPKDVSASSKVREPSLEIRRPVQEDEIMSLLEALTVRPLREISLPVSLLFSQSIREEVCRKCREKGIGTFILDLQKISISGSSSDECP